MIEVKVSFDYISNDFELRIARKRDFAREHDIQDDA